MKKRQDLKLSVRNVLGIKHADDWIFNLNIGNVMHLSLMNTEELNASLDTTHELCKDAMLEKIVLASVAYFCIGTEMRFLMNKSDPAKSAELKRDSEAWHAKALHIGSLFLPPDCPLISHVMSSYQKNYMREKPKEVIAPRRSSINGREQSSALKGANKDGKVIRKPPANIHS